MNDVKLVIVQYDNTTGKSLIFESDCMTNDIKNNIIDKILKHDPYDLHFDCDSFGTSVLKCVNDDSIEIVGVVSGIRQHSTHHRFNDDELLGDIDRFMRPLSTIEHRTKYTDDCCDIVSVESFENIDGSWCKYAFSKCTDDENVITTIKYVCIRE